MARPSPPAAPTLAEAIREAIRSSGQTVYAVAKAAGVSQPVLHRFVAGERGLTLDTADKLCRYLGLRLVKAESDR